MLYEIFYRCAFLPGKLVLVMGFTLQITVVSHIFCLYTDDKEKPIFTISVLHAFPSDSNFSNGRVKTYLIKILLQTVKSLKEYFVSRVKQIAVQPWCSLPLDHVNYNLNLVFQVM